MVFLLCLEVLLCSLRHGKFVESQHSFPVDVILRGQVGHVVCRSVGGGEAPRSCRARMQHGDAHFVRIRTDLYFSTAVRALWTRTLPRS